MVPAQQRLTTDDLMGREADERLVAQMEFPLRERVAQIELQAAPILHHRAHGGFIKSIHAAAVRFCPV